jgi:hypothetical protein
MAELLKEIDEPPPGPRRFDRDGSLRRELREEIRESHGIVGESLLDDFSVVRFKPRQLVVTVEARLQSGSRHLT